MIPLPCHDLDGDALGTVADLMQVVSRLGDLSAVPLMDIVPDGTVDLTDVDEVAGHWRCRQVGHAGMGLSGNPLYGWIAEDVVLVNDLGASRWRHGVDWDWVEATKDVYDWTLMDAVVSGLRGADTSIVILTPPTWVMSCISDPLDDAGISEFSEFVSDFVERYDLDGMNDSPFGADAQVYTVQFFNEPDKVSGTCDGNVAYGAGSGYMQWARLQRAAYLAAKAANPRVIVLGPALAAEDGYGFRLGFAEDYMAYSQATWGRQFFDRFDFHYYDGISGFSNLTAKIAWARGLMAEHANYPRHVVMTEIGQSSNAIGEAAQANVLTSMFQQAQAAGALYAMWYNVREDGRGFGLIDGTRKKPAYFAYQDLAQ